MTNEEPLHERLQRWSNIARGAFLSNWAESNLLHSFGDKLSKDLKEAAEIIKTKTKGTQE